MILAGQYLTDTAVRFAYEPLNRVFLYYITPNVLHASTVVPSSLSPPEPHSRAIQREIPSAPLLNPPGRRRRRGFHVLFPTNRSCVANRNAARTGRAGKRFRVNTKRARSVAPSDDKRDKTTTPIVDPNEIVSFHSARRRIDRTVDIPPELRVRTTRPIQIVAVKRKIEKTFTPCFENRFGIFVCAKSPGIRLSTVPKRQQSHIILHEHATHAASSNNNASAIYARHRVRTTSPPLLPS